MRHTFIIVAAIAAWFVGVAADAQQAPQPAAPQAQPGPGPGPGKGPGPRAGMGPGVGPDYTHGWGMMSPAERDAHRQQMHGAKTAGDCREIRDEHRKQMTERAKAQGAAGMPNPRQNACANFPS